MARIDDDSSDEGTRARSTSKKSLKSSPKKRTQNDSDTSDNEPIKRVTDDEEEEDDEEEGEEYEIESILEAKRGIFPEVGPSHSRSWTRLRQRTARRVDGDTWSSGRASVRSTTAGSTRRTRGESARPRGSACSRFSVLTRPA